jgi:hypothetical protein
MRAPDRLEFALRFWRGPRRDWELHHDRDRRIPCDCPACKMFEHHPACVRCQADFSCAERERAELEAADIAPSQLDLFGDDAR